MNDIQSFSSRSSSLFLSNDDDENDEIVIFEEDDNEPGIVDVEEDYEYDYHFDGEVPPGYTVAELEQQVVFVRSSKDPKSGDFSRERKSLLWCVKNGCEETQPGVWSGFWYFTYLFGEEEGRQAWVEATNKRLVKEGGGKAVKIDHGDFCAMLSQKEKGRRAFSRGQYKAALDCYCEAEKLLGGGISGLYLVPHQRAEMVKILSNQAECCLRLRKYEQAVVQSTAALKLDKRHEKSLLRRAKALVYGSEPRRPLNSMVAAIATEDLRLIFQIKGDGMSEAQALMNEIESKSNVNFACSQQ